VVITPDATARNKTSAVKVSMEPYTGQQLSVDNRLVPTMRNVIGSNKNKGSSQVL
jgi:hypothetical protein